MTTTSNMIQTGPNNETCLHEDMFLRKIVKQTLPNQRYQQKEILDRYLKDNNRRDTELLIIDCTNYVRGSGITMMCQTLALAEAHLGNNVLVMTSSSHPTKFTVNKVAEMSNLGSMVIPDNISILSHNTRLTGMRYDIIFYDVWSPIRGSVRNSAEMTMIKDMVIDWQITTRASRAVICCGS